MSAGPFVAAGYVPDVGTTVFPVRVQPETLTGWNPNGGVPTAFAPRIRVRQSRRAFGVYCRRIYGVFVTTPDGYKPGSSVTIPILTKAAYDSIILDEELAYLTGGLIRVTGKSGEQGL